MDKTLGLVDKVAHLVDKTVTLVDIIIFMDKTRSSVVPIAALVYIIILVNIVPRLLNIIS